jgi:hypothetical protein
MDAHPREIQHATIPTCFLEQKLRYSLEAATGHPGAPPAVFQGHD